MYDCAAARSSSAQTKYATPKMRCRIRWRCRFRRRRRRRCLRRHLDEHGNDPVEKRLPTNEGSLVDEFENFPRVKKRAAFVCGPPSDVIEASAIIGTALAVAL